MMGVDRAALQEFFTGSRTVGAYPDTLYGRVERWRRELLAECRDRKVEVHLTGVKEKQTHRPVSTPLADVAAQCAERWPDPDRTDGRSWTLSQSVEQVALCCVALDAADRAGEGKAPEKPAAPSPTPKPAASSWPPQGCAWHAEWDGSDPLDGGRFKSAPWNYQSASPVVRSGRLHIEFLPNGAQAPGKGAEKSGYARRCEVEPNLPGSVTPQSGRTVWHRWDLNLVNFPVSTTAWNTLVQFKGDGTGSPPLAIEVNRGQWTLVGINNSGKRVFRHVLGIAAQGRSTTLVLGVTFGTSGHLVGYQDGKKTLDVAAPTMHPGKGSYGKGPGLYCDDALSGPLCLEVDRMAVGPTLASVTT